MKLSSDRVVTFGQPACALDTTEPVSANPILEFHA